MGVSPGMTLAHARALLITADPSAEKGICIHPLDPEGDRRALRRLAQWADRFAPRVSIDPPDGLRLDITGCEALFRGEDRHAGWIARAIHALGFHVRMAIASTFGCARAMSRFGVSARGESAVGGLIANVAPGQERAAMSALPVESIVTDPAQIQRLREVGLDRVGDLLRQHRCELAARELDRQEAADGGSLLRRMDEALGLAPEAMDVVPRADEPLAERCFDGPVLSSEGIAQTVQQLLVELVEQLVRRERGAQEIAIRLERVNAPPVLRRLSLSRPVRDPARLWALVRPDVEQANLGFGVERVVISSPWTRSLPHGQRLIGGQTVRLAERGSSAPARARRRRTKQEESRACLGTCIGTGALLDTLSARLGPEALLGVVLCDTHQPEEMGRVVPIERAVRGHDDEIDFPVGAALPVCAIERPILVAVVCDEEGFPRGWRLEGGRRADRLMSEVDERSGGAFRMVRVVSGPQRIGRPWWRQFESCPRRPPPRGGSPPTRMGHEPARGDAPGKGVAETSDRLRRAGEATASIRPYGQKHAPDGRVQEESALPIEVMAWREYFIVEDESGAWIHLACDRIEGEGGTRWWLVGAWV